MRSSLVLAALVAATTGCSVGQLDLQADPNGAQMTVYVDGSKAADVSVCLDPGFLSCGRQSLNDTCSVFFHLPTTTTLTPTTTLPFVPLAIDGGQDEGVFEATVVGPIDAKSTANVQCTSAGQTFTGTAVVPAELTLASPVDEQTFSGGARVVLQWQTSNESDDAVTWMAVGTCPSSGWSTSWSTDDTGDTGQLDITSALRAFTHGETCAIDLSVARTRAGTTSPPRSDVGILAGQKRTVKIHLGP